MSLPEEGYEDGQLTSYRCPRCGEELSAEPDGCRDLMCPAWRYYSQEIERTEDGDD